MRPAVMAWHGNTSRRWIALTFDAGSDTGTTAAVLDILAAHHVTATFSLTGDWVRANPALARRIAVAGHTIVNHTDDHDSFTGYSTHTAPLTSWERRAELQRAETTILQTTGVSPRPWFRPPYGDTDAATPRDVGAAGYSYILMWTVDSLGWKGFSADAVVQRVLAAATPGGIVLMHVGSASTDVLALPRIIDGLAARGYQFVSVGAPGFIR
ncbi:MAG TPA: polysaccharide deacetylase family protein [Acidimicrobiia bacterium]|nr:polysaccharide deacetylase family protein [Acidimicrobiia bacterium]